MEVLCTTRRMTSLFEKSEEVRSGLKSLEEYFNKNSWDALTAYPILTSHFISQAIFRAYQGRGDVWKNWNKGFTWKLIKIQKDDGSWDREMEPGISASPKEKEIYSTALSKLMFEIYSANFPFQKTYKLPGKDEKIPSSGTEKGLIIK